MNEGILLGLLAALSFGTSDTFAALTSRRIGAIRAATGTLVVSLAAMIVVALLLRPALPADPGWIPPVFALGTLVGFAYLCLVNALRLGPISVVSPVFAGTGAATVVFAVLITGDQPALQEWVGVAAAGGGAILVALSGAAGRGGGAGVPRVAVGPGPLFALAAVLGYSISIILLQGPIRDVGWLPTLVVWRAGNLLDRLGRVPHRPPAPGRADAARGRAARARRRAVRASPAPICSIASGAGRPRSGSR